jgi:histidinol-phosphate aminotransferase
VSAAALARPEIRALAAYRPARQQPGTLRLNANEASWAAPGAPGLNRYPPVRAAELQARLAELYGVPSASLLATRGSSEAIDLLVRAFCRPGRDSVVISPPTFDMYRVYAGIQGAAVISVRLREDDFSLDVDAVLSACEPETKLVFVCSPNNPTGALVPAGDVLRLAQARLGRSLVVVDEAYIEFSGTPSLASTAAASSNLVVLRTLSKALALAGARCGAAIGPPEVIELVDKLLAPYALSQPVIEHVEAALSASNLQRAESAAREIAEERERVAAELASCTLVSRVWPSRANFLLVRFAEPARARALLAERRILVRELDDDALQGCARITIGTREENERLLAALRAAEAAA